MEFVQFHPTTLYSTTNLRFLISEAVRGEGAVLRGPQGNAFMRQYHPMADLAPRDVVARAIDREMKPIGRATRLARYHTSPRGIPARAFSAHLQDMPPARDRHGPRHDSGCAGGPLHMWGRGDQSGKRDVAPRTLCLRGEVACTGLHGANRLASNSLLEAVVMAHRGADAVDAFLKTSKPSRIRIPRWRRSRWRTEDERVVVSHNWDELRRTMWDYVGIMRTTKRLERARTRIANLKKEIHEYYWNFSVEPRLLELRNLAQVAELIVDCALQRHESRGLHATLDYPRQLRTARDSVVRNR